MDRGRSTRSDSLGKVLITGGAGFVGSNLIARIQELNLARHVRVLDNECTGNRQTLSDLDVEFFLGDMRDQTVLKNCVRGMDRIIHLAADTRVIDSIENPQFNFENNVIATLNLLMAMRDLGVGELVNASTGGAIIGEAAPPVHEEMPTRPISPYGASKAAAEAYCSGFAAAYGLRAISLRFANVYGPRSFHKGSVVATFMRNMLSGETLTVFGDGTQTRDFVFAPDLADGIVLALQSELSGVFQLGSGQATELNTIISLLQSLAGSRTNLDVTFKDFRAGEVVDTYCDITKARSQLDFNPKTSLQDGLSRTWDWFQRHAQA